MDAAEYDGWAWGGMDAAEQDRVDGVEWNGCSSPALGAHRQTFVHECALLILNFASLRITIKPFLIGSEYSNCKSPFSLSHHVTRHSSSKFS